LSDGSRAWRQKVAFFAEILQKHHGEPVRDIDDLTRLLGSKWCYRHKEYIKALVAPPAREGGTA
jgi:hypothetical protein